MAVPAIQEHPETIQPRIYVACLAAYNNGYLHGAWIDAAQDAWSIWDEVKAMLDASPIFEAEEWAIHDYEGFEGLRIEEYTSFETVSSLAALVQEHGKLGAELVNLFGGDLAEAEQALEERYHGCHTSLADYMQELTEETSTIPEHLRFYIDWQSMARDAELYGDLFTVQTGFEAVHVFRGQ